MQIYGLEYKLTTKEQRIRILVEENDHFVHTILILKSSNHINTKILIHNSNIRFADTKSIVKLSASEEFFKKTMRTSELSKPQGSNHLLNLLSFSQQAETKTLDSSQ